jgi:predicted RNA binding protein YcfA (HicA-like mRNA interferase family)
MMKPKWKLKDEIERNTKNVSFDKLWTLLRSFGFELRSTKGSHRIVKREGSQPLTIPYSRKLKQTYVRQALSRINELVAQGEFDDRERH